MKNHVHLSNLTKLTVNVIEANDYCKYTYVDMIFK